MLSEGLRKYLQWPTFITQIFLYISLQPRPLLGDHQEAGGGDGPGEREEKGGEPDHPASVDKSDHTDQLILSPSPVFKTPTLLLLLLLLLLLQLSPVLKCPTPPVGDDIDILDVLLVGDGHRYIFCDIESQRERTQLENDECWPAAILSWSLGTRHNHHHPTQANCINNYN